jgi:hypothetical protein
VSCCRRAPNSDSQSKRHPRDRPTLSKMCQMPSPNNPQIQSHSIIIVSKIKGNIKPIDLRNCWFHKCLFQVLVVLKNKSRISDSLQSTDTE